VAADHRIDDLSEPAAWGGSAHDRILWAGDLPWGCQLVAIVNGRCCRCRAPFGITLRWLDPDHLRANFS
jgi:hypothetical protein